MIIYRVEITVEAAIELEWFDWMKRVHVPDVVRTGCFSECRIYKVIDFTVGLRPTVEREREGLDLTDHGERAYNM